jgi:hypothetical protein
LLGKTAERFLQKGESPLTSVGVFSSQGVRIMSGLASELLPQCRLSLEDKDLEVMNLAIISQAPNGAAAFRGLYELHKSLYKPMSFGYIMRRSGITSKGYLSHVMNGDRRLNARYHDAICAIFKLNAAASQALRAIWLHDEALLRDRRAAHNAAHYKRPAPRPGAPLNQPEQAASA